MIDETHLELLKLADFLSNNGISIQTALRFFGTMLKNDASLLSELKIMNYAEKIFKKKFVKNSETPDLISEDKTIAIEVKSFNKIPNFKNAIKLWWITNKNEKYRLKQLGTLILLKEQGINVYVAIHDKANDIITFYNLDNILEHVPSNYVEMAKRYALEKHRGRPPKVKDEILLRYYKKYRNLPKKYIWYKLREDGYDISYDRFLRRLKKLIK